MFPLTLFIFMIFCSSELPNSIIFGETPDFRYYKTSSLKRPKESKFIPPWSIKFLNSS